MNTSSLTTGLDTARLAVFANVALVLTGSVLALVNVLDLWTGIVVVCAGLIGVYVSLLGRSEESD
ncbi:hypothetical protein QA600_16515 [Natronococcus sp. A-GB1]|jgi:hypothetical protein|uniref:Major facilitator family transporter n=1 Tax=Natronococcus amylolyticus DSM 10524 TaxID=1227497 RepID=L9X5B1_9EURY|nr:MULTISPECIES: hypothetical protein [Natronococcus]ELY56807.1 major facilitator family transporter [Natronococcus amylolyticus DSM 10524]MDG5760937.1 hypothetical protein [Natronococcus sp. A-GB1]